MIAKVYVEDYDENGLIEKTFLVEDESKGTLLRISKKCAKNITQER